MRRHVCPLSRTWNPSLCLMTNHISSTNCAASMYPLNSADSTESVGDDDGTITLHIPAYNKSAVHTFKQNLRFKWSYLMWDGLKRRFWSGWRFEVRRWWWWIRHWIILWQITISKEPSISGLPKSADTNSTIPIPIPIYGSGEGPRNEILDTETEDWIALKFMSRQCYEESYETAKRYLVWHLTWHPEYVLCRPLDPILHANGLTNDEIGRHLEKAEECEGYQTWK